NGNVNKIKNYRSLEFAKNKNEFLQLWRNIMAGNMIPISAKVKALALMVKSDRNSFEDFFRMMMYWFRDAQSLDAGATLEKLILFQFQDEIQKFATYYHGSDYYNLILKAEQVIELSAKNLYIPALVSHFFVTIQKELQQARMRSR
ncbi:MAG: hypothetical protein KAI81_05555, partial [Candidatus Marinimicrobia bacterium]|nr:hypothetical protein [Candidatus Neomarinimicrobiota bacterium]